VDPAVAASYEQTSEYEFDVWSEWSWAFRPFGGMLALLFSQRLQQLNHLAPRKAKKRRPRGAFAAKT
jgi:hypothetical protein